MPWLKRKKKCEYCRTPQHLTRSPVQWILFFIYSFNFFLLLVFFSFYRHSIYLYRINSFSVRLNAFTFFRGTVATDALYYWNECDCRRWGNGTYDIIFVQLSIDGWCWIFSTVFFFNLHCWLALLKRIEVKSEGMWLKKNWSINYYSCSPMNMKMFRQKYYFRRRRKQMVHAEDVTQNTFPIATIICHKMFRTHTTHIMTFMCHSKGCPLCVCAQ